MALIGLAGGCVTGGVPNWAMHVQPQTVDLAMPDDVVLGQLMTELQHRRLGHEHLAPEQIALVGLRELQQGRLVDAGLWLSIASYRYHQEAQEAFMRGTAALPHLPAYVKRAEYKKLVVAEIRRFARLGFYGEVWEIQGRLRGQDDKEVALQDQLATLGKTDPIDRESLRDVWAELQPNNSARNDVSRYPKLVEAFRHRLRTDAADDPDDRNPPNYLGVTPVPLLKKEAVFADVRYFDPITSQGVVAGFPALRSTMIAALASDRPQARAQAAATLALAPSDETRALVQARRSDEMDGQVLLVFAYALARHGVPDQIRPLTDALQACQGSGCSLPVMLVQWLPIALKIDLDQTPLARIVADKQQEVTTRLFAAAALRSISRQKPLAPASVEALIVAARYPFDDDTRLQEIASEVVAQAGFLSREVVIRRLAGSGALDAQTTWDARYPCGLLARLAKVSTAEDLPLLGNLMTRFGAEDGIEAFYIAQAVLNVRGPDAREMLVAWFREHKKVQTAIAVGLEARGDVPRDQLELLIASGDVRTVITVQALRHDPSIEKTLIRGLDSSEVADRVQAAELAGLVGGGAAVDQRLQEMLSYHSARYYPADALVRHTAMAALVRRQLAKSKPPVAPPPAPSPQRP